MCLLIFVARLSKKLIIIKLQTRVRYRGRIQRRFFRIILRIYRLVLDVSSALHSGRLNPIFVRETKKSRRDENIAAVIFVKSFEIGHIERANARCNYHPFRAREIHSHLLSVSLSLFGLFLLSRSFAPSFLTSRFLFNLPSPRPWRLDRSP